MKVLGEFIKSRIGTLGKAGLNPWVMIGISVLSSETVRKVLGEVIDSLFEDVSED